MSHDNGTANPQWFRPDVDPMAIRKLMQKSDAIALRDTFFMAWSDVFISWYCYCALAILVVRSILALIRCFIRIRVRFPMA
jgi:hypothetical protein